MELKVTSFIPGSTDKSFAIKTIGSREQFLWTKLVSSRYFIN